MLIIIILIPVFAALAALALPGKRALWPVLAGGVAAFLLSGWLLFHVLNNGPIVSEINGFPGMPFLLEAGNFSAIILMVVTAVALSIFVYSKGYMSSGPGKKTFWAGMALFLAAMELLVLSADWISFIVGWELMGFASYRLIATWHEEEGAQNGATKAFMLTRVTDMGLYIGVFLTILHSGSSEINAASGNIPLLAGFALMFAVMGKSAQVPFQSWLSGAMAGPTPVSSLLHSATMVAAGIILMLKSFPVLPHEILSWIGFAGAITILLTGLTAIFASDLKQMLAASTSSHLGFMLLAIGAGFPGAAVAHLLAHAFMKSSLFLGAGIWQHEYKSTRFENLQSAGKSNKFTFALFAVSAVALAGIPPLIGYFSKDAVLAAGLKSNLAPAYFSIATVGALLTALYMGRALQLIRKKEGKEPVHVPKINWMRSGMAVLVLVILAGGFFLKPVVKFMNFEMPHSVAAIVAGVSAAVAGLVVGWFFFSKEFKSRIAEFVRNNYAIAGGYKKWVVFPVMQIAHFFNFVEKGLDTAVQFTGELFYLVSTSFFQLDQLVERLTRFLGRFNLRLGQWTNSSDEAGLEEAIAGITQTIKNLGRQGQKLQNGLVHREMLWSVIGFIGFLLIMILINS